MNTNEIRIGSLWQHHSVESYIVLVLSRRTDSHGGGYVVLWNDQKGFLTDEAFTFGYRELK